MNESIALHQARRLWGARARVVDRGPGYGLSAAARAALQLEMERLEQARPRDYRSKLESLRARLDTRHRYQVGYDDWDAGLDVFVVMGQGASFEEAFDQARRRQDRIDRTRNLAAISRFGR